MLKKPASSVLASFRSSTYRLRFSEAEMLEGFIRSPGSIVRANGPTKCGGYLLRSSLAAALLDGLFEHLAYIRSYDSMYHHSSVLGRKTDFSASC
jgi:hypothetical protein